MFSNKLKLLRRALNLTQTAFGERLGVSVDVIKNLEYSRTTPTELFTKHLCEVYNVNRDWLEDKSDDMFLATDDDAVLVEKFLKQSNPSPAVRSLLYSWLQLPPDKRLILEEFAEDFAARHHENESE